MTTKHMRCIAKKLSVRFHRRHIKIAILTAVLAIALEMLKYMWYWAYSEAASTSIFIAWPVSLFIILCVILFVNMKVVNMEGIFVLYIVLQFAFLFVILPWTLVPDRYRPIESRYCTIVVPPEMEGRSGLHANELYSKATVERNALKQLKVASCFLFWQTGYGAGSHATLISEREYCIDYICWIGLFFTVGILMLVEATIVGLTCNFVPLIIAQMLIYIINGRYIFFVED